MKNVFTNSEGRVIGIGASHNGATTVVTASSSATMTTTVPVDFEVDIGWTMEMVDEIPVFTPPTSAPAVTVGPIEFQLLFTGPERRGIAALRADDTPDENLEDFMTLVEHPKLTAVNLGLKSVRDGVRLAFMLLVASGVVQEADMEDRIAAVLSGKFE